MIDMLSGLSGIHLATDAVIIAIAGAPSLVALARRRRENLQSDQRLATSIERTKTLDRLLDFSQTLQGAGRPQQVYDTLCHYLHTELNLSGVVIVEFDADVPGGPQFKSSLPSDLIRVDSTLADLDGNQCPCIRQNLPREFCGKSTPVRCSIDNSLCLPISHPAYCVPMQIGPKRRLLMHMLLPASQQWTPTRCQLAQTYANTAQASLMTLHLLHDAEQRTMTDPLTGLYNRRSMESLMEREVALAERHQRALSLVMIDIDFFKQVNDTHGHAAGDHLIRCFADCVRMTLRKTDLAFRYGGDEFAVALPQTPVSQAQQVVQKLRQAFASVDFSSAIAKLDRQPTLSIGLVERNAAWNLLTLPALISAADQALYDAKAANRNCVRVYSPPKAA